MKKQMREESAIDDCAKKGSVGQCTNRNFAIDENITLLCFMVIVDGISTITSLRLDSRRRLCLLGTWFHRQTNLRAENAD